MGSPSEDIKDILEAESSLSLTFGANLFISREPAEPDAVVTIFDTPGFAPDLTMNKNERYDRPSIQIRVRNNNYADGYALSDSIKEILHGKGHEIWNSTSYELIKAANDISLLDYDESNRVRFVITFDIQRKPV